MSASEREPVVEGEILPPRGVTWGVNEREVWLDLFQGYSDTLVGATIEEHAGISKAYPVEQFREDIKLAGELADAALAEVQWRFHNHPPHTKQRERRRAAPAPVQRGRARR